MYVLILFVSHFAPPFKPIEGNYCMSLPVLLFFFFFWGPSVVYCPFVHIFTPMVDLLLSTIKILVKLLEMIWCYTSGFVV